MPDLSFAMRSLADDITPKLGGDLDANGHLIAGAAGSEIVRLSGVTAAIEEQLRYAVDNLLPIIKVGGIGETISSVYAATVGYCWGNQTAVIQPVHSAITGFNRVIIPIAITDPAAIPAKFRLQIRSAAYNGAVLAEALAYLNYTAALHTGHVASGSSFEAGKLLKIVFDLPVTVSASGALFLALYADGQFSLGANNSISVNTYLRSAPLSIIDLTTNLSSPISLREMAADYQLVEKIPDLTNHPEYARIGGHHGAVNRLRNAALASLFSGGDSLVNVYALSGRECNIYYDNVFRYPGLNFARDLEVECTSSTVGKQLAECWRYLPPANDSGTLSLTFTGNYGELQVFSKTTNLIIKQASAGNGVTRKILAIGDSTGTGWLGELVNLFNYNQISPTPGGGADVMGITLVGGRTDAVYDAELNVRNCANEALTGWTWNMLQTQNCFEYGDAQGQLSSWNFTGHKAANTGNGWLYWKLTNSGSTRTVEVYKDSLGGNLVCSGSRSGNGAVTLAEQNSSGISGSVVVTYTQDDTDLNNNKLNMNLFHDGTRFDFAGYLTRNSLTLSSGDWVLIHLGINDVGAITNDAALWSLFGVISNAISAVVGFGTSPAQYSIRAAVSGIRVGIMLPIPPAAQDPFGTLFGSGMSRLRYNRSMQLLREYLIRNYGDKTSQNIYLVPVHYNIDPVHAFPITTENTSYRDNTQVIRQTNNVHPAAGGYYQMADAMKTFLKAQE